MKTFVKVLSGLFFGVVALGFVAPANAAKDPVEGFWKTIDDKDKKPKSIVKIWQQSGKFYGKIVKLFRKDNPCPKCKKCSGFRKNKPTCGMVMMWGLSKAGKKTEYKGGKILDPKNGKIYRAKIWLDAKKPKQLKVRGYLFVFFRTQTWHRAKNPTQGTCVQKCGPKKAKAAKAVKAVKAAKAAKAVKKKK